ncbi:MAG: hypothetical protein MR660_01020 [Peptoniphilaceae bacterium]|nr:hypothetical protein [Peptoniphilaceae bacterium]MDY5842158.1 GH25 family lysozyme [Peptoniphilaceae bacterium]MDY6147037.1 GH25 family lysozyme [Peptoniphilaceae bacterium]
MKHSPWKKSAVSLALAAILLFQPISAAQAAEDPGRSTVQEPSSPEMEEKGAVEQPEAPQNILQPESDTSENATPSEEIPSQERSSLPAEENASSDEESPIPETVESEDDKELNSENKMPMSAMPRSAGIALISFPSPLTLAADCDGRSFYDENSQRILSGWVHYQGSYYFLNGSGELYRNRFITYGAEIAYLLDSQGRMIRGQAHYNGKNYFLDSDTGRLRMDNAWVSYNGKDYFPNAEGELYSERFITFGNSERYLMDASGAKVHGISPWNGKNYLLDPDTGRLRMDNAWVSYNGKDYFPNAEGELYSDRFITFGSSESYLMDSAGAKTKGIGALNGRRYLLDPDTGNLRRDNRWVTYEGEDYFPNAEGELYTNRFLTFGPRGSYFVDSTGKKCKGFLERYDKLYLLDPTTGRLREDNAWVSYNGKEYFPNAEGELYKNRFINFGSDEYLLNSQGEKVKGPQYFQNELYLLDWDTGLLHKKSGWVEHDGKYYFSQANGQLFHNQIISFGSDRYLIGTMGERLYGTQKLNGRYYYMNEKTGLIEAYSNDARWKLEKPQLVIDLSHHQDPLKMNFDAISASIRGVILRAGYTGHGTGNTYYKDQTFETYFREFRKRGIPIGVYWYSCADTPEEGVAEAKFLMSAIAGKQFELPVYWDTEDVYHQAKVSPQQLTDTGIAFLETLRGAGYYVGIYSSANWYKTHLDMSRMREYEVWVAHYGVASPRYYDPYSMWQFTSEYRLPGFDANLDASWMYYDLQKIIQLGGHNGW